MENKIKAIIQKVREIYRCDLDKSDILSNSADIEVEETEDGEIELESIIFANQYGRIYVYNTAIVYMSKCANVTKILGYKNWDELINM